jgi:hypothetical protein
MRFAWRLTTVGVAILAVVAGCRIRPDYAPRVKRTLELKDMFDGKSEAVLASLTIQSDTLGRRGIGPRELPNLRRTQCVSYEAHTHPLEALKAARHLADRNERVPFDSTMLVALCANHAWTLAFNLTGRPPLPWIAEHTAWQLLSMHRKHRRQALVRFDSSLSASLDRGDSSDVRDALTVFAGEIWIRAQARLERPVKGVHDEEWEVHRLDAEVPPLRTLAPIPRTSRELGVSEAEWSARLYTQVARLTPSPARSRMLRLALAPWVATGRWASLDSAARAMLTWAPHDSALVLALPLAQYHLSDQSIRALVSLDAAFDTALRALPRVDSSRYDSFDGVLTVDDDEWRYDFLPSDRLQIDQRGWAMIDPMWSTAVNEIRLARRVRMAHADYRYADMARKGQSGSETPSGRVHMRLGAPTARWEYLYTHDWFHYYVRRWDGLDQHIKIEDLVEWWRAFAGGRQRAGVLGWWQADRSRGRCPAFTAMGSVFRCVENERARWNDTPFVGRMDTIDVMLARFRHSGDSVDLHVEARVPLRAFPHRDMPRSRKSDRIVTTFFLRTPLGEPLSSWSHVESLPSARTLSSVQQWQVRTGTGRQMHRIEAMDSASGGAARGVMRYTSDAAVEVPVQGFGLSDVLVTGHATPRRTPALRWSDYVMSPNAGVILPKDRFSVLWEIYELTPDRNGRVRWRVDVRREVGTAVSVADMREVLTSARRAPAKVLADEPDAASFSYEREAPARPVVAEHIKLAMPERVPFGRHVLHIAVTDLVSGRQVVRSTPIRVLIPSLQQRISPRMPTIPFENR